MTSPGGNETGSTTAHGITRIMPRAPALVAGALVATIAVPVLIGGRETLAQTLSFPVSGYLMLLTAIAVCWLARAMKMQLLMRQLDLHSGFARVFAISLATDFAFISTPGGVGGYAASIYYVRREGASMSAATTIAVADQLLDLAFFAVALPLAGLMVSSELPRPLTVLAFGASALMVAIGAGTLLARGKIATWLANENLLTRRWPRLRRRQQTLHEFLSSVAAHMRLLRHGGIMNLLALTGSTAVQWTTRYGALWIALTVLGDKVPFALTLLLQSLVLHAALWTGVPSGAGGAELGLSATLAPWVPVASLAPALLLWRITTFYVCLMAGAIAISLLSQRHPHSAELHMLDSNPAEESAG